MKITFNVTVTIDRINEQPLEEFRKEDGKAMIPYLKEKIEESLVDTWQYNAKVYNVKVTRKKDIQTVHK